MSVDCRFKAFHYVFGLKLFDFLDCSLRHLLDIEELGVDENVGQFESLAGCCAKLKDSKHYF